MDTPIYLITKRLASNLVNASSEGDTARYWTHYHALEELCLSNEKNEYNHPFQWETLADFTTDSNASLPLYEKAFTLAEKLQLNEYMASIKLASAERYRDLGTHKLAYSTAKSANDYAIKTNDLVLRKEISSFLLQENISH